SKARLSFFLPSRHRDKAAFIRGELRHIVQGQRGQGNVRHEIVRVLFTSPVPVLCQQVAGQHFSQVGQISGRFLPPLFRQGLSDFHVDDLSHGSHLPGGRGGREVREVGPQVVLVENRDFIFRAKLG